MALDTKFRDEFIELSHEDTGIEFVALQPVAIVDHVCSVDEVTLKSIISSDEIGGSGRVGMNEIQRILGKGSACLVVTGKSPEHVVHVRALLFTMQPRLVNTRPRPEDRLQIPSKAWPQALV